MLALAAWTESGSGDCGEQEHGNGNEVNSAVTTSSVNFYVKKSELHFPYKLPISLSKHFHKKGCVML